MANIQQMQFVFPVVQADEMLREGKPHQAAALLEVHLQTNPDDAGAWYQLSRAYSQPQVRQHYKALKAVRQALRIKPAERSYLRQLAFGMYNQGRFNEAIHQLQSMPASTPEDYSAMQILLMAYCKSGKNKEAIAIGRRLLQIDDQAAQLHLLPPLPSSSAVVQDPRKIITYSLWGANPVYNYGAMINARLSLFMYPGWQCRFYLGQDVPASTVETLKKSGAEVVHAAIAHPGVAPAMWRFLVADDPTVGMFLCRDCDARLSPKEAAAVDTWLRSGKRAHVMRDHPMHRVLIMAGMWGARTQKPLRVTERMKQFSGGKIVAGYGADQIFLANEIWPEIRADCTVHDSYYDLFGAQPFPALGKGDDNFHVGMGVIEADVLKHEAQLMGIPWYD